ncbi:MAG: hypothetical protein WBM62_01325 [Crocosphaera sp.]
MNALINTGNLNQDQKEILDCFYIAWTQFHFDLTIEELENYKKLDSLGSSQKNQFGILDKKIIDVFSSKRNINYLTLEEYKEVANILEKIINGNDKEILKLETLAENSSNLGKFYEDAEVSIHEQQKQKGETRFLSDNSIDRGNYLSILSIITALNKTFYGENRETSSQWQYLEPRPHSWRKQLFFKGRRLRPSTVWISMLVEKMTPEETADDWELSLDEVNEAIAYCEANQEVLKQDAEAERLYLEEGGVELEPKTAG